MSAPGAPQQPLLEVADLHVRYRHPPMHAVRGVSLAVARGETLGLVGESGCGKSSLARAVLGLEEAAGGRVVLDGVDLETATKAQRFALRRRLQPVFQDPASALDPRMTVGASIAEPLVIHGQGDEAAQAKAVGELLAAVQLPVAVAERMPHELSAGQRQRVNLARALALEPELLVLDEPVSALDVSVQAQMLNLLLALKSQRSLALLFISHDLAVVAHLADRLAVMYAGVVVEEGPAAELLAAPRHPYTRALVASAQGGVAAVAGEGGALPSHGCRFAPRCPSAFEACRGEEPALLGGPRRAACFAVERDG